MPGPVVVAGLAAGAAAVASALSLASIATAPVEELARQAAWQLAPNRLIDIGTVTDLSVRRMMPFEDVVKYAAANGYNRTQLEHLIQLRYTRADAQTIIAASYRDPSIAAFSETLLTQLGYSGFDQKIIRTAAAFLPGPADLIRFLVRDIYTPTIVDQFGLYDNYPPAFTPLAAQQGMSEQTARDYWAAHWTLPSLTQGFTMLQQHQIKEADLRLILRANDTLQKFVDPLIAISYTPLGRIDIRRFNALGLLDGEDLICAYEANGYNRANAELSAQWTVKYNAQVKKEYKNPYTAGVVSHVLSAMTALSITQAEGTKYLTDLGKTPTEIASLTAEAVLSQQIARQRNIATSVRPFYVDGIWTELQTMQALAAYGFTGPAVTVLLEDWRIDRQLKVSRSTHASDRDLTKAEIVSAYKDRIVTKPEAVAHLTLLGYDASEVQTLIALADYAQAKADQADRVAITNARYISGKISDVAAAIALDAAGLTSTRRDALIAKWDLQRLAKQADLTVAQVTAAFVQGVWTDTKAAAYLPRLGYDADEVLTLMALAGSQVQKAQLAAKEKAAKVAAKTLKAPGGI